VLLVDWCPVNTLHWDYHSHGILGLYILGYSIKKEGGGGRMYKYDLVGGGNVGKSILYAGSRKSIILCMGVSIIQLFCMGVSKIQYVCRGVSRKVSKGL